MTEFIIPLDAPFIAARKEIRCLSVSITNNLGVSPNRPAVKYNMVLQPIGEYQTVDGMPTGPRELMRPVQVPMAEVLATTFSVAGVTATGSQILALLNAVVDAYKTTPPVADESRE